MKLASITLALLDPESQPGGGDELEGKTRALTVASTFSAAGMCYINISRRAEKRRDPNELQKN